MQPDNHSSPSIVVSGLRPFHWYLLIALLACLAFQPALRNQLTFDDIRQTREVPQPHALSEWSHALLAPWWPPDNPHTLWRPVARISILIQNALQANLTWPFYGLNIVLLIIASCLLTAVARQLDFSFAAAGLSGCIFAVHPLHSEAVHQVVGRTELFASVFMLLGIYLLLRGGWRAWWQWPAQALCYALALGSKESAIIYPVYPFLLLLLYWRSAPDNNAISLREGLLHFARLLPVWVAVGALFIWLRYRITGGVMITAHETSWVDNPIFDWTFVRRVPVFFGVFGFAFAHFFWPVGLCPDYGTISLPVMTGWQWPYSWFGLVLIIVLAAYALISFRRGGRGWGLALAGLSGYLITSNLFFTVGVLVAERLWFWPSAALCLAVAWWLDRLLGRAALQMNMAGHQRLQFLVIAVLLVLLLGADWKYAAAWRSEITMADYTLDLYPNNARANLNVARLAHDQGDFKTGYLYGTRAVQIYPSAPSYLMLGINASPIAEHQAEAAEAFARVLAYEPENADAQREWGTMLQNQGRTTEALQRYRLCVQHPNARHREEIEARIRFLESKK